MVQILKVQIQIPIIYLSSETLGQMVVYEILVGFTPLLVIALHTESLDIISKTSVSFKQGSKLLKVLYIH